MLNLYFSSQSIIAGAGPLAKNIGPERTDDIRKDLGLTELTIVAYTAHGMEDDRERILAAEPRSKVTALAPLGMGRLAVASADGAIRVWDAARGVLMHDLGDHNGWVTFLAATPDGKLVSGGADNCVRLWDPLTGSCIRVFPASPGDAQVPCFAAQGVSGRLTTGRWCFTLPGGHDIVLEAKEFTL